jgi:hypothetical protein
VLPRLRPGRVAVLLCTGIRAGELLAVDITDLGWEP